MEKTNSTKPSRRLALLLSLSLLLLLYGCTTPTPQPPPSTPMPPPSLPTPPVNNSPSGPGPNTTINEPGPRTSTNTSFASCSTQDCFLTAANACQASQWTNSDDVATFQYSSTASCVFSKTLTSLNSNESVQMKAFLEGKGLTCIYQKGNFDSHLVTSWVAGTENCAGPLKDAIGELLLFAK